MSNFVLKLRLQLPSDVLTDTEIITLSIGTADRRYGLVKRAIASGDLIQLRRGVYALGKSFQRRPLNTFETAQKLYAPSYISFETALSHHGWIPEAVYTVTSACLKRSTAFETVVGNFSYTSMPRFNFVGVDRTQQGTSVFLIASPLKALVDYVLAHKADPKDPVTLLDSLRIDDEQRQQISFKTLDEIVQPYHSDRASSFARALRQALTR